MTRIHTLLLTALLSMSLGVQAKVEIANLRCEHQVTPLAIENVRPLFSWQYKGQGEFYQMAYELRMSDCKDSLYAESAFSTGQQPCSVSSVEVDTKGYLKPRTRYYWQVIAWDESGKQELKSGISSFETGLMGLENWKASWITDSNDKDFEASPMLRRKFSIDSKVKEARLYVSGAAYYVMSLNGKPVTDAILSPGYTHYDKRNLYQVFDVTKLLKKGDNAMAAVLGNGFYNNQKQTAVWKFENARWRGRPRMICELHMLMQDGTEQVILSDSQWKTATGPFIRNDIYSGDTYDARKAIPGWKEVGFDDSQWKAATVVAAPSQMLIAQQMGLIAPEETMKPTKMQNFGDTVYVYSFPHNMSGYSHLKVGKGEAGTELELYHGELLHEDGRIDMRNITPHFRPKPGFEFQRDVYITNGEPDEFSSQFNYKGFQYVEIRCSRPFHLDENSLTATFCHTAMAPAGSFSCSNEKMNTLWEMCNLSYLCNSMSIPTDCPHREKNGWTADAWMTVENGFNNYDCILFYEKWMNDLADNIREDGRVSGIIPDDTWGYDDWIGPVWDAVMFIIPATMYDYGADKRVAEMLWPHWLRYLKYLKTRENEEGTPTYGIGDWVPFKTSTRTDFTTTCAYFLDYKLMARFARLLGRDDSFYENKAEKIRDLINTKYFNPYEYTYAGGTQAAQAVSLYLGIVPDGMEQFVADKLADMVSKNDTIPDFGMLGTKTVLRVLTKYGYADLAYALASQEKEPGWISWVNSGYSTLPESWQHQDSMNHQFLGDINSWMYNMLAGINPDPEKPGFKHIVFTPHFVKGLDWAKAERETPAGTVASGWKRLSNGKVELTVTIPLNATGTVECEGRNIELRSGTHTILF